MAEIKVYRQNLLLKLSNYQQLNSHTFEKRFQENIAIHMQKYQKQFKSKKKVSHKKVKRHQVLGYQ